MQFKKRRIKYGNRKVEINGLKFDSAKEASYYRTLLLLKNAKAAADRVIDIELQPVFIIQDGFRHGNKWILPIKYIADFRVTYGDSRVEVIDVKGFKTEIYKMKYKMFIKRYPDIDFREIT